MKQKRQTQAYEKAQKLLPVSVPYTKKWVV